MATVLACGSLPRTYSTLALAKAAIPTPTPTGGYIIEMYNDTEFANQYLDFSGYTTNVTNFITVTAAATQSFQDHASVRSNALYYDQSKGVGINTDPYNTGIIRINNDWVTISRLQIKATVGGYALPMIEVSTSGFDNVLVKDCIIQKSYAQATTVVRIRTGKIINCLVLNTSNTHGDGITLYQTTGKLGYAINCTVVNTGTVSGTGIASNGDSTGDNFINNCAVFGFSTAATATVPQGNYNATNLASGLPGANSAYNKTASTEFESATVDFRLKTGATLIGAGNTDATNAPNDISGYARGAATAGDIGAWEATVTGGTVPIFNQHRRRR